MPSGKLNEPMISADKVLHEDVDAVVGRNRTIRFLLFYFHFSVGEKLTPRAPLFPSLRGSDRDEGVPAGL